MKVFGIIAGLIAAFFLMSILAASCAIMVMNTPHSGYVAPSHKFPSDQYAHSVKVRIDRMENRNDCNGLQREFDKADANDEATRNRTGEGSAKLLDYIDNAMRDANCY